MKSKKSKQKTNPVCAIFSNADGGAFFNPDANTSYPYYMVLTT